MKYTFTSWFLIAAIPLFLGCGLNRQVQREHVPYPTMQEWNAVGPIQLEQRRPEQTTLPLLVRSESSMHPESQSFDDDPMLEGPNLAPIHIAESVHLASMDRVQAEGDVAVNAPAKLASLEDLLALAFANNPAIRELAATTQIAAGYRTQVGLYANPIVGYQGQQLADAGTDQHLVFLQQRIITGGKLELNRSVLNEAVRAQLQELEAQKLRVATDIKVVYFDCVRLQEQLAAIDQFSNHLSQGVDVADKRMQAGEGSRIDLLQTQVQFQQLELDRRQRKVTLDARLREIAALAGLPSLRLSGVIGTLPSPASIPDWTTLEEGLVAMSPEYAAALARIGQAAAEVRRHEVQTIPNVDIQFGAGVDNGTNSGMMNVQVGAPVPWFNKNQGNLAAARAEYCRAVQEAQRIDCAIRARLAVAAGAYERAREAVQMFSQELLPKAQETLDLAESAYKAGEQDFIQLLVTRRTFFDTSLASIAARADLATAEAQIDGYLLTGALNTVIHSSGSDSLRGLTLDQE